MFFNQDNKDLFGNANTDKQNQPFGMSNQQASPQPKTFGAAEHGSILNAQSSPRTQQDAIAPRAFDEDILKDVPVSIRQKSFGELLSFLKRQLEENVREFKKKALETFAYDEKIIKARNNYARILQMVKSETEKLNELEENVDFFLQYVRDMDKKPGEDAMNVVREVEKLSDEVNVVLQQIKDEDNDVLELVNENMNLVRIIDERLNEMDK